MRLGIRHRSPPIPALHHDASNPTNADNVLFSLSVLRHSLYITFPLRNVAKHPGSASSFLDTWHQQQPRQQLIKPISKTTPDILELIRNKSSVAQKWRGGPRIAKPNRLWEIRRMPVTRRIRNPTQNTRRHFNHCSTQQASPRRLFSQGDKEDIIL
jgi:hypothetical protein